MLLTPGPVELHPRVRASLALPMIHHRTPEFDNILAKTLHNLKFIFQTQQDVFLWSSTGSGGMEALLVNTLSPGNRVLAIISGKFGERWAHIAEALGMDVLKIHVPWGSAVDPLAVEEALNTEKDVKAVLCQACETSTAVSHPIAAIGKIIMQKPETLFLVDGITALGAYPLPMDDWHIDGLVGGSQKAFMLPTGLSLVSFSQKAWTKIPHAKCPRYYFDVRFEQRSNQKGETFFSSNVSLIRALHVVTEMILEMGLDSHFNQIARRAQFVRKFSQRVGFTLYGSAPSLSVTALGIPQHLDSQKLRTYLEEKHDITIMGGQDQLKGKILRIGHMGYIQDPDLLRLIECLAHTLRHFDSTLLPPHLIEEILLEAQKFLHEHPCPPGGAS